MNNITELRTQINEINEQLVALIIQRNNISRKIGAEKTKLRLPIYDRSRENDIYTKIERKYPEHFKHLIPIFEEIIKQSRLLQN
jgi:chorismate mutase